MAGFTRLDPVDHRHQADTRIGRHGRTSTIVNSALVRWH
jgi:hypothetical protein